LTLACPSSQAFWHPVFGPKRALWADEHVLMSSYEHVLIRSCRKSRRACAHEHLWAASYPGANNVLKIATLQCFYIDQWLRWASARGCLGRTRETKCLAEFVTNMADMRMQMRKLLDYTKWNWKAFPANERYIWKRFYVQMITALIIRIFPRKRYYIKDLLYGCRIVAKFNTHNLYSIRTFYIQYTHFIFNTHILYSIHS
jgi:hypothetical protein